jgi:hypothetical protein
MRLGPAWRPSACLAIRRSSALLALLLLAAAGWPPCCARVAPTLRSGGARALRSQAPQEAPRAPLTAAPQHSPGTVVVGGDDGSAQLAAALMNATITEVGAAKRVQDAPSRAAPAQPSPCALPPLDESVRRPGSTAPRRAGLTPHRCPPAAADPPGLQPL